MSDPCNITPRFMALALVGALAACSNDVVDLGGGMLTQSIEPGTACGGSPIVEGDVSVENQKQLDALLGCEEIRGNLVIYVFEGTDLTPLAQLQAVDGNLVIGGYHGEPPVTEEDLEALLAEQERLDAIVAAGWLPSLSGVESIERVGGLSLSHFSAPSLEVFESLRLVTGYNGLLGGRLSISALPHLVNLAGLENARGYLSIEVMGNPALASLDGLVVGDSLDLVHLRHNPALTDIDALSPLETTNAVFFEHIGITNVDALANLANLWSGSLFLSNNPELTQVDVLTGLGSVGSLGFERCPKLERLPDFPYLSGLNFFMVAGNESLKNVPLDLPTLAANQAFFGYSPMTTGMIQIVGNPQLESLSVVSGFRGAEVLTISHNTGLTRIDLGPLERLDQLQINGNTALTEVALGALETVDSLSVVANPLLPTAELRNLRTFESELRYNADDPPAP